MSGRFRWVEIGFIVFIFISAFGARATPSANPASWVFILGVLLAYEIYLCAVLLEAKNYVSVEGELLDVKAASWFGNNLLNSETTKFRILYRYSFGGQSYTGRMLNLRPLTFRATCGDRKLLGHLRNFGFATSTGVRVFVLTKNPMQSALSIDIDRLVVFFIALLTLLIAILTQLMTTT